MERVCLWLFFSRFGDFLRVATTQDLKRLFGVDDPASSSFAVRGSKMKSQDIATRLIIDIQAEDHMENSKERQGDFTSFPHLSPREWPHHHY